MVRLKKISAIVFVFSIIFLLAAKGQSLPTKRYVCQGVGNLDASDNNAIATMNKMVDIGCNSVLLTVYWDRVYPLATSKPNFSQLDNQINHAINKLGIKVAIRIHVGRNYELTKGFWEKEDAMLDFKGNVLTEYYNNNHFSFAHQPSIDKTTGFVKEVCERYKNYQKSGKIIFISVVNTPQQELGYAFQNQQWPSKQYPAMFDHSKWAMIRFKNWAKQKYTNLKTLNAYWNNNFRDFGDVSPYVNLFNIQDSFRGLSGKDWYVFRHLMLKNYYEQIIDAIKSVDPTYKVACEFGGIADNLSLLRSTYAFKDLTAKADILKTSTEGLQGDLGVSNLNPNQKLYTEVAFFDLQTSEDLKNYVKRSMEYGCEFMMLGVESNDTKEFEKILPAVQEAVRWIDKPVTPTVFDDSTKYRLSQLIDNKDIILNDWRVKSDNGKKKIKAILEEDIIVENKKSIIPIPDAIDSTKTIIFPPKQDGPNQPPGESVKNYTKDIIVNTGFQFRIPDDLYYDTDGYIIFMEVLEKPSWANFNAYELRFFGRASILGKNKVRIRVTDNNGASFESTIYLNVVPPNIDFEVMTADYFDMPLKTWGMIEDKSIIYLNILPPKLNILANCNLDSVEVHFDLIGPYKFNRISDRLPFNLFGEGRGLEFPVGTYILNAKAYRNDTVVSSKRVQFFVSKSNILLEDKMLDWQVYPNPFEQVCNIKIPDNEELADLEFILFTSNGQKKVLKKDLLLFNNKIVNIDLNNLDVPSGNYILEVNKSGKLLKRTRISKF